ASKRETDRARIGVGGEDEIVFQLRIVSVIDHVDARINVSKLNATVSVDLRMPLLRIVAEEVIDDPGQLLETLSRRVGLGAGERDFHGSMRDAVFRAEIQQYALAVEKEIVAGPARQKLEALISLAAICFEVEWALSESSARRFNRVVGV